MAGATLGRSGCVASTLHDSLCCSVFHGCLVQSCCYHGSSGAALLSMNSRVLAGMLWSDTAPPPPPSSRTCVVTVARWRIRTCCHGPPQRRAGCRCETLRVRVTSLAVSSLRADGDAKMRASPAAASVSPGLPIASLLLVRACGRLRLLSSVLSCVAHAARVARGRTRRSRACSQCYRTSTRIRLDPSLCTAGCTTPSAVAVAGHRVSRSPCMSLRTSSQPCVRACAGVCSHGKASTCSGRRSARCFLCSSLLLSPRRHLASQRAVSCVCRSSIRTCARTTRARVTVCNQFSVAVDWPPFVQLTLSGHVISRRLRDQLRRSRCTALDELPW
jgi:hypothetical protein